MAITLKGDKKISTVPTTNSKALKINLNSHIYGTFAEIGAGQETVRNFFRAGGASGTIAKAMSAYDKDFSDAIYGIENDNRYVTEKRLKKMLKHEMDLIEDRLDRQKHPDKLFFSYANTVATINFSKKFKGHGWVGIRFQLDPLEDYNEIILHLRFKETDARQQQETLGVLGVNLVYGAYYLNDNPKELLKSFYDNIDSDRLEIDMINFSGPRFTYVDNRLMSLQLVKNGMTNAVMFGPDGNNLLPAQVLYKKNILALRGSYRPVTKVNMDMFERSKQLFLADKKVNPDKTQIIFEITLSNLRSEGEINERDFLDRAELLCALGQNVMITNYQEYFKLVDYFGEFTKERMALTMGVQSLVQIFDEKYYRNLSGGILEASGKLFYRDLKIYTYPYKDQETGEFINTENLKVHPRMKELYKFFKHNGRFVDIKNLDEDSLHIFSRKVLKMIKNNEEGWEKMLPEGVSKTIKDKRLFGCSRKRV
ncbi:nicotinate-nucleotide adenylyltransferase [Tenacibaculum finnmarkense]|uniref:TonB-dependent receptor n=1 Tax=Tenacibaculum finnmarkense genomovar finnmarkense TaxID=1458503 RepID=A0AAP1WGE2_9FLAO|nr:nicotinate-nucleotide adenylyltransferase [Tenacibaculum finnmarkense]MBE7652988.1 TonB-dependent receptor [Tenacibaculum finnmarkense genomovar finnmarkense]MBE7661273.1 TonB-dependent receptor [Tenacibaculum finnmarkense genomovar finnmarkense]MBE7692338.1 TonB-dependent receptor [Tenacibaculum finnmarkense genomovar finnmarkense]MBE7695289.1 TonB-dependent receptor [Tenacibaculum finnmarkense genomovar finnmarkense]MCD8402500.1 TonB-dependent receptor [Tenacibaculum finnmarkense genomova